MPLTDFEFSLRVENVFARYNIASLGDLVKMTERQLLGLGGMGRGSIREVKEALAKRGFYLGMKA
jgi:DNA-directed RNA polymerase subunit alpha